MARVTIEGDLALESLRPALPSEQDNRKKNCDSRCYQSACPNFLAGEADMNMKKMTQHGRGYSRHHNKHEQVPHPGTDWIHAGNSLPFQPHDKPTSTMRGPSVLACRLF
jgi:hypothetical protein